MSGISRAVAQLAANALADLIALHGAPKGAASEAPGEKAIASVRDHFTLRRARTTLTYLMQELEAPAVPATSPPTTPAVATSTADLDPALMWWRLGGASGDGIHAHHIRAQDVLLRVTNLDPAPADGNSQEAIDFALTVLDRADRLV